MNLFRPTNDSARVLLLAAISIAAGNSPLHSQGREPPSQLTLQSAVEHALQQHPNALAAEAGVKAATAAVGEVSATRLPQVGFEASATRYQEPMIVAPLHALDITQAPQFDRTLIRGSASVAYTLFDGGGRGSRVRGARAEAEAAQHGLESAVASLINSVTKTYLQVLTARDVISAHDTRLEALEAERDRVSRMFAEGTTAQVSVLRAEAAIAQALAEKVAAESSLDIAVLSLARLTGLNASAVAAEKLVPVRLHNPDQSLDRAGLMADAAAANPELQRALSKAEVAQAARRGATAAWYPSVSLFGGYLGFGSASGDLVTEWQGGAKVTYPVFTGGARSKTNARAAALADYAAQEVRLMEITIQDGVDRALSAVHDSRVRVTAVQDAVDHLSEVARIERLSLDTGAGTLTEYLRSEAELLRARAMLIEVRNAEIAARVEVARIVGQLNTTWLERELESTP